MARNLILLLVLGLLPGSLRGVDGWTQLKLGMTAEAAEAALGAPLIRNEGRGFERWIYDGRAEVLFYGGVIAWTAPASASAPIAHAQMEVWEFYQAAPNRPRDPIPPRKRAPTPRENSPMQQDFGTDFRYPRRL